MKESLAVGFVTVFLAVIVTIGSLLLFDMQPDPNFPDAIGEAVVAVTALLCVLFITRVSRNPKPKAFLTTGAMLLYFGMLIDLYDELVIAPTPVALAEDVSIALGLGLLAFGLFLFIRDQGKLHDRLRQLSITDELTGLFNSRHFYDQISREIERSHRYERSLSILLMDIDDFKKYNDEFGHIDGDRVLRYLGALIQSVLRENDSGYRYGGEEFTIILPETKEDKAIIVAERIRSEFKTHDFVPGKNGTTITKTISVGVAEYRGETELSAYIRRADFAMYSAKSAGKDMVTVG